jgi:hypothetical protein
MSTFNDTTITNVEPVQNVTDVAVRGREGASLVVVGGGRRLSELHEEFVSVGTAPSLLNGDVRAHGHVVRVRTVHHKAETQVMVSCLVFSCH